jgi:hypothetical protein
MKFTIDHSARKSRQYFDSTFKSSLVHEDKDYYFDDLKTLILKGKIPITIYQSDIDIIECELREDKWYDGFIPYVIKSNHIVYGVGTRFDYGFMLCAMRDGFTIVYHEFKK